MPTLRKLAVAALALAVAMLAACASGTPADEASSATSVAGDESAFPVTIEHAFGSTTIESKPTRIATVAWANHEVPLALGIVPVGMSKATWGDDDDDGLLPWVKTALDERGGETPVLFDETDGIPFEAVSETKPDVILASYSGITQEDYDQLSQIAPVVAYPGVAWGTSYEDMIRMNSKAIGMAAEGDKLIEDLHTQVDEAFAKYPDLKGAKVLFSSHNAEDLSKIGFYSDKDPRPSFLYSIGFEAPSVVTEESGKSDAFWIEISAEQPELFEDVDLIVTYGPEDPAAALAEMQAHPLLSRIPAVKDGHVVFLGEKPLAAAANPSPLSISWGIDDYFEKLHDGLR